MLTKNPSRKCWATDYFEILEFTCDLWERREKFCPEETERLLTIEETLYSIAGSALAAGARMFRVEQH